MTVQSTTGREPLESSHAARSQAAANDLGHVAESPPGNDSGAYPETTSASESSPGNINRSRTGRWWLAVVVGCVVSLPLAWLLSHAAMLPFFLGLFFFMLFGLMIGAAMYRVASPARPYGSIVLTTGTTIVVLCCWLLALFQESCDFPKDMANLAAARTRDLGDRTIDEFRTDVANDVRRHLRQRYSSDGMFGYVRWALTNGMLKRGDIQGVKSTLSTRQTRWKWAIRAVLSIALLALGIGSQTFPLHLSKDAATRSSSSPPPATGDEHASPSI